MYSASQISFAADRKKILDSVGLAIRPGELAAVAGPNGAGKSTLIKILAGEHTHYTGEVTVNGKNIRHYTSRELSRVRAVMAQSTVIQFGFSVTQVVALSRYAHPSTARENQRIVDEVMDRTGVLALRDRNYLTLSGGEKQRVQFARALAQVWEETLHPRYILLDEPTASMDIAQQQMMLSLARNVCSRNIGILAIVHDLNLAVRYADQMYFIRGGKAIANGEATQVFTKRNIEDTFCCKVNVYHDPCGNCPYVVPVPDGFAEPIRMTR